MTLRLVPDGPELTIRRIRPEDKELLVAGLGKLSQETVYKRFLTPKPKFTGAELRYLTEVDFHDHYALVAVLADHPKVLVAVGRWVRLHDEPQAAEVAIVVADPLQGRGIGTTLGSQLADAALEHGVERFTATMLADNVPAHRLFERISDRLETRYDGALHELVAELAAA